MRDLMGMMKKAQELQDKMGEMQQQLAETEVTGNAGGGMVTITLTAKGDMRGIVIDPSLLADGDASILEDLIGAAHADARQKADALTQEKMAEMTEGLPIPPGMKLPF